jgi:hypothetical protein
MESVRETGAAAREIRRTLTLGGYHGDGRPNMQDPEEDPTFREEIFERLLERVPAPAKRHRHRPADGSLHRREPLHAVSTDSQFQRDTDGGGVGS